MPRAVESYKAELWGPYVAAWGEAAGVASGHMAAELRQACVPVVPWGSDLGYFVPLWAYHLGTYERVSRALAVMKPTGLAALFALGGYPALAAVVGEAP